MQSFAFGKSNRETGLANTALTKFRIGSMSKSFTSAAILKLAEDGILSIDDLASKWLPDYPPAHLEKDGQAVTLRHLMSHESGIPNWEETQFFKDHVFVKLVCLSEIMASVSSLPLDTKPGTVYAYSNTGYNLLALIVERASGMPFEAYLKRFIFPSAHLENSGINLPNQDGLAKGYFKDPDNASW